MRTQLSIALQGIVTQQLLPTADGTGRVVACEVLVPTPGDPQPDPRGQDPPDLRRASRPRARSGCRRWTPTWRGSSATGKITRSLAEQRASVPEELKRLLGGGAGAEHAPAAATAQPAPPPPPAYAHGGLADGRRDHLRLPGDGPRPAPPRRARSRPSPRPQVTEQLRQRGLIVLDVSEKSEPFKHRGLLQALAGRRHARAGGLLAPVRDPGRLRDADAAHPAHARGADPGRADPARRSAGVRADVEAGSSLEQAMERHPKVFDRLFRAMVRSGEQSGRLEEALDRIAFQVEKADALRRQVKSALMYPALVFGFAVVVLVAIVAFVIPVFANIFKELGRRTPGGSGRPAAADPDLRRRLQRAHRLLVHPHSRRSSLAVFVFFRWKKTERGHEVVGPLQAADPVQNRRRDPEGRAGALVAHLRRRRSPPACRCCRRSS